MKINNLLESKKLPGQFGAQVMSPEEFVAADEAGIDVDPNKIDQDLDENKPQRDTNRLWQMISDYERRAKMSKNDIRKQHYMKMADELRTKLPTNESEVVEPKVRMNDYLKLADKLHDAMMAASQRNDTQTYNKLKEKYLELEKRAKQGMIPEATKLPAQSRELGGQEFQDYMTRIKGTDDIDKKTGEVKVDKKGIPKYTTGKTKSDKYKMPYIHRSSAIEYYSEEGKRYKEEAVIDALKQRPKKLLKQNEKMKHSNGELEQFFNVGFAALTGIAVDESTGKLIIVNTCPGAGSCKVDCFAMKGGKVQFKAAWLSDGRILTYLLNDPDGFFNQLSAEISKEEKLGDKGGYEVTIRWHDAGDFFSPEYLDMALKMAEKHPGVKFYAYTKMANAALANKPGNFIINWSEGAHTSQEKQVKAADPELERTKNSRIVPTDAFDDLLVKNEKGNLIKGPDGQWQIQPDKQQELKHRLGKLYNISPSSILTYDEYTGKPKVAGMKYNVIVAPGEGDISANDPNVLGTLLLKH
jgi:Gene product 88